MPTNTTGRAAYLGNVYRDGYTLLQSFTTGDTALAVQTTAISQATLDGLSGVMKLGAGDGVELCMLGTTSASAISFMLTGFTPVLNEDGEIAAYIEREVSGASLTGALGTDTAGAALAAAIPAIPSGALFVDDFGTPSSPMTGFTVHNLSGRAAWARFAPAQGITHVRALIGCETADQSVFCLARRLVGNSQNL